MRQHEATVQGFGRRMLRQQRLIRGVFGSPLRVRLVAVVVAAMVALFPVSVPAHADTLQCETPVLDLTDGHVLDTPTVIGGVAQLSDATGADVFVRAFQSTPGGTAAVWWADAYPKCPAWLGADGKTPKPNVMVIEFGMDHTSAIEYGSNFHRLDSQVDQLRAGMGKHLRQGNYTGAVIDTLSSLQTALTSPASDSAKPGSQSHDWTVFKRDVSIFLTVIAVIAVVWLLVFVLIRLRAARLRRVRARQRLAKAHSDAATAVLASDLTAPRIQIDTARSDAEDGVSLEAIDNLAAEQGDLSGEFAQWSDQPVPTSTEELHSRAARFERITTGLQKVQSDADALVAAAEKRVADCTPARKRADLDAELQLLDDQKREIEFLSVEPITQRAALRAARDKLTSLALSMDNGGSPLRNDIDSALDDSATTRSAVAKQVSRGREAHADLNRIAEKAERAQQRYSSVVSGVTADTAASVVSTAAAVESDVQRLQCRLGAGELELDSLVSEVASLDARMNAATAEADKQHKKHKASRRAHTGYPSDRRSPSSSSSDFSAGLITGTILGSHSDASSSSSYDYGGGSSGGWDSGFSSGGDFGGGSSGSW